MAGDDTGERCSCGRVHPHGVETVVIDHGAIYRLSEYGMDRGWRRPFVVMDQNTAEVLGYQVIAELRRPGVVIGAFTYPEREGLLADESGVARLEAALASSAADAIVAVGSGVITDLTRFVAHRHGRSFVSVPTAASMDGYASSVAAMEFGGMKTTSLAVAPTAIFADPSVIAEAPEAMTRSGIGDLLGKASAHVDWRLSSGLFGEERCPVVEASVAVPMLEVARHVPEILGRSVGGVTELLGGLIESGIAMAMVGSSRPASGCEHHASHFWDQLAQAGRHGHAAHGLQVGYATHFALRLQHFALAFGRHCPPPPRPRGKESGEARAWFVGHEAEVDAVLSEKDAFLAEHLGHWPAGEASWEEIVSGTRSARAVAPLVDGALSVAGIPSAVGFLELDATTLKATLRYANRIRARYSVIDFLEGQDLLEEAIEWTLDAIEEPIPSL